MSALDTDGDGSLTKEEFRAMPGLDDMCPEELDDFFARGLGFRV